MINMMLYKALALTTHGKIQKNHTKTIDLKFSSEMESRDWITW